VETPIKFSERSRSGPDTPFEKGGQKEAAPKRISIPDLNHGAWKKTSFFEGIAAGVVDSANLG
jgi:hypothetical protein